MPKNRIETVEPVIKRDAPDALFGVPISSSRAVLVAVAMPGHYDAAERPLDELKRLCDTAAVMPVAEVIQRRSAADPSLYLGRGKTQEAAALVRQHGARIVVFDNDLSPAQQRNLEAVLGVRVVDRTELILHIFALRARTRQAKIQVELAQYQYMLPRLRRRWTHLERQVGGIAVRGGMGEKQIEVDRRRILRHVKRDQQELANIEKRRRREVLARRDFYNVSLVGYTNAGKSTLLNALTGSREFVEDRLFATLDTRTRLFKLGGGLEVLLSDTVGFIRRVPAGLISSFKATLEEVRGADLLLHVVDAAHPGFHEQLEAVEEVLEDIGAAGIPRLLVFNKMDLVGDGVVVRNFLWRHADAVAISALRESGLDALRQSVRQEMLKAAETYEILLPVGDGRSPAFLSTRGIVESRQVDGEYVNWRVRMPPHVYDYFRERYHYF